MGEIEHILSAAEVERVTKEFEKRAAEGHMPSDIKKFGRRRIDAQTGASKGDKNKGGKNVR